MFCYICGKELKKNAKYCTDCGASVKMLIEEESKTDMVINQPAQTDRNEGLKLKYLNTSSMNAGEINKYHGNNGLFTFGFILIFIGFVGLVGVVEKYGSSRELRQKWIPALPLFLAAVLIVGIILMVISKTPKK